MDFKFISSWNVFFNILFKILWIMSNTTKWIHQKLLNSHKFIVPRIMLGLPFKMCPVVLFINYYMSNLIKKYKDNLYIIKHFNVRCEKCICMSLLTKYSLAHSLINQVWQCLYPFSLLNILYARPRLLASQQTADCCWILSHYYSF